MISSILVAIVFFIITLLPVILAICISYKFLALYIITFLIFGIAKHTAHSDDEIESWQEDYYDGLDDQN